MQPFLPRAGYDTNTFHTIWHIRGVFTYVVYLEHVYEKPKDTCLFAICGNPLVTSQIQYSSHPEVRLYEVSDVKQTLSSSVLSVKIKQIRNKYVFTRLKGMSSVSFMFMFENNIQVHLNKLECRGKVHLFQ